MPSKNNAALLIERYNQMKNAGNYKVGHRVPTTKALMRLWYLSEGGVEAVLRQMKKRGFIKSIRRGYSIFEK